MTKVMFDPDKIETRKGRPEEIVFSRIREAVELVDSTLDVRIRQAETLQKAGRVQVVTTAASPPIFSSFVTGR